MDVSNHLGRGDSAGNGTLSKSLLSMVMVRLSSGEFPLQALTTEWLWHTARELGHVPGVCDWLSEYSLQYRVCAWNRRKGCSRLIGIGKFHEFSDLQAKLLSPLHTGVSAVCSSAVAPHLAVMGFASGVIRGVAIGSEKQDRRSTRPRPVERNHPNIRRDDLRRPWKTPKREWPARDSNAGPPEREYGGPPLSRLARRGGCILLAEAEEALRGGPDSVYLSTQSRELTSSVAKATGARHCKVPEFHGDAVTRGEEGIKRRLEDNFANSSREKIDVKHVYSEVTFTIRSQFIRPALHASEPIADLQGNTLRISLLPGVGQQPMNTELRLQDPDGVAPRYMHVGIFPDDATGRRVLSGISLVFRRCSILTSLHTYRYSIAHWPREAVETDLGSDWLLLVMEYSLLEAVHDKAIVRLPSDKLISKELIAERLCAILLGSGFIFLACGRSPQYTLEFHFCIGTYYVPQLGPECCHTRASEEMWAGVNNEVSIADEGEVRRVWSSVGMQGPGKPRENPPTSSIVRHDLHTCENSGAAPPGIEPGSCRWDASRMITAPQWIPEVMIPPMRVIEVNMEQRRNEGAGETPWWEASVLIAQPPRSLNCKCVWGNARRQRDIGDTGRYLRLVATLNQRNVRRRAVRYPRQLCPFVIFGLSRVRECSSAFTRADPHRLNSAGTLSKTSPNIDRTFSLHAIRQRPHKQLPMRVSRCHLVYCSHRRRLNVPWADYFQGAAAVADRAGRCRWSAGFLGDLPFPLLLHSGAAPYSPHFTLIGYREEPSKYIHSIHRSYLETQPHTQAKWRHRAATRWNAVRQLAPCNLLVNQQLNQYSRGKKAGRCWDSEVGVTALLGFVLSPTFPPPQNTEEYRGIAAPFRLCVFSALRHHGGKSLWTEVACLFDTPGGCSGIAAVATSSARRTLQQDVANKQLRLQRPKYGVRQERVTLHLKIKMKDRLTPPPPNSFVSSVPNTLSIKNILSNPGAAVQSPAGSPDFRIWESCRTMTLVSGFSRRSPTSPALSFRRRSILTSITLIGSQDHAVKSRPNLFTYSLSHSGRNLS
ncbi:hypothetical protein PR048_010338 [Dryococelus australis]|uniref:Uncharacterized protein n=1 Tax=Dryococelus australis TaxID=614101 RepID=A0ABQ9I3J1_9NEOP|nr:hypothetical protein PR048_010338 [Dryococelus australis]